MLTLYKAKKLLIQGAGTWTWRNTVFQSLSNKLSLCGLDDSLNGSISSTPQHSKTKSRQLEKTNTTSSPANFLNRVLNKIKSPRAASTPLSSSQNHSHLTRDKNRRTTSDDAKLTSQTNSDQSGHSTIETDSELDSEDEITCVKQLYTSNHEAPQKQQNNSCQDTISLNSFKTELEKYKKENKELQETSRKLLKETKTLKQDHDKVLKVLEAKNNEINSSKKKYQTTTITLQERDQSIMELKEKLVSASADRLLFQEQNNKLKADMKTLQTEKTKLVEKLMHNAGATDTIESKIEIEVGTLKEELLTEILQIKEQVKKSMDLQSKLCTGTSSTHNNKDQVSQRNSSRTSYLGNATLRRWDL